MSRTFAHRYALLLSRLATLLSLALVAACQPPAPAGPLGGGPTSPEHRSPAPEWKLQDFEGNRVSSSDYLGKVVILDFWATWCPPCRQLIPGFVSLQKKYGEQGLVILGVDVGPEPSATVERFVQKMQINYKILASAESVEQALGGVDAIPTCFIIDRQGRVAGRHVGYAPVLTFEKQIKPLLAEQP